MMSDSESFVHDLLLPDSNTRRFHAGDACQWSPPTPEGEVEPQVAAMIAAHRASIHAPGSRTQGRFGLDEDGNPIETSYLGVGLDPETGETFPLDNEGNRVVIGAAATTEAATPPPPPPPTTTTTSAPKPTTTSSTSTSSTG